MANLPLAFAELLLGAIVLDAGIKGASLGDVVRGHAKQTQIAGLSGTGPGSPGNLAGNAITGAGAAIGGALGAPGSYVNPVPGASLSRTDEGVDYTLSSAHGFVAPGNSVIVTTNGGWFKGGSIVARLLDGPYKGAEYFVAEGVRPAAGIAAGVTVRAGQKIADPIASPYNGILGNIEAGWWRNGVPLAQSTGGYFEGEVTAAGAAWDDFVRSLGGTAHGSNAAHGSVSGLSKGQF